MKDTTSVSEHWQPDILGAGFEQLVIPLGPDPDGEGNVQATLVHLEENDSPSAPAMLYVHGMDDYFFQTHEAKFFADHGYSFYALDLRKCGRSRLPGQTWHYISDIDLYFKELDLAAEIIVSKHNKLIPMGHSTGGLTVALWVDHLRRERPDLHSHIPAALFNSPWLDLMIPSIIIRILYPAIDVLGKLFPRHELPSGTLKAYGESIYKGAHGSYDFDLDKKPLDGHPKYLGWLRAVARGQHRIHTNHINCGVPTLTVCSSKSSSGKRFTEESTHTDTVLNVRQIERYAPYLSTVATLQTIDGALHDVFLSAPKPQAQAGEVYIAWLNDLKILENVN